MSFFKTYFNFTRRERNGIIFLLFLIVLAWGFYLSVKYFNKRDESNFYEFESAVKYFYYQIENKSFKKHKKDSIVYNKDTCLVYINRPKYEHLLCLGLSNQLSQKWINYVTKGGKFKSIEDVKRLWGMNDSIFNLIKNYLVLKEYNDVDMVKNISLSNKVQVIRMIEINTADTNELKDLPGIGSTFARRIVKYKERLGGYVSKEQLKEIYGFSSELYEKIAPYIYVDIFEVKKININNSDYLTLIQHPYFNKEIVKSILQLRKKNGKITSKDDLLNNEILTDDEWNKVKYYIEF